MQLLLFIIAICCSFLALIFFCQSMNNAFKKSFLWGIIFLVFIPVGNYFYYKKFFAEEKNNIMGLAVSIDIAIFAVALATALY